MVAKDPVCGECGQRYSRHYHEDQEYCNGNTTGDVFTDEPSDSAIMSLLRKDYSMIVDAAVTVWKLRNGHTSE